MFYKKEHKFLEFQGYYAIWIHSSYKAGNKSIDGRGQKMGTMWNPSTKISNRHCQKWKWMDWLAFPFLCDWEYDAPSLFAFLQILWPGLLDQTELISPTKLLLLVFHLPIRAYHHRTLAGCFSLTEYRLCFHSLGKVWASESRFLGNTARTDQSPGNLNL